MLGSDISRDSLKRGALTNSGVFVKVSGEGPVLVLLHGLFGSLENLGGIARYLSKRFKVYSLDLPNHGRSQHVDDSSLESFVRQLKACLGELNLTNVFILGHSLGGKVAMELALTSPEYVQKLVVIDIAPVKYSSRHDKIFEGLLSLNLKALSSRTEADKNLQLYEPEIAVRSFLLKNLAKDDNGHFLWRMNLSAIHKYYSNLIDENTHSVYSNPVLLLKGSDSDYILEKHREDILARFPKIQLKVISDTAHWLHAEKPEMVSNIVSRFLSD